MTTIRCFFIGHRAAPEELFPALAQEVERHITEFGVREFIVGGTDASTRWPRARCVTQKSATRRQR